MDFADYVRQISFRFLQPESPRPSGFRALERLAHRAGINLEMWMTALPEEQETMQRRLRRVCRMRRRSTFAIGAIINRGVEQLPPSQAFLCLGVGSGYALLAAMAGHRDRVCIGVDALENRSSSGAAFFKRFERWKGPRHEFHQRDFRDYLTRVHAGLIGYCACAGRHTYRDRCDALQLAEPFFAPGALLLFDDANRNEVRRAAADFLTASPFEYRTLLDVRTPRSGHPTFGNGVLLFRRGTRKAECAFPAIEEGRAA